MSATAFQPAMIGGALGRRIAARRAWVDELPWDESLPSDADAARWMWTQTSFSEYAAAASFSDIASALLAAGAPIDLVAIASDFVVDETIHVEVSARIAAALGGGVTLEVDLERLVRPALAADPRLRALEAVVRTSCVGEALTVPLLRLGRDIGDSRLVCGALERILLDEAQHSQFGWWVLDWADAWLDEASRDHLGRIAGAALRSFAPLLGGSCTSAGLGALGCDRYDPTFAAAAATRVAKPLAARGITVPPADLQVVGASP